MKRMGIAGQPSLTDLEKVHVAIAYNAGSFKPAKGLKQGFFRRKKVLRRDDFRFSADVTDSIHPGDSLHDSRAGAR